MSDGPTSEPGILSDDVFRALVESSVSPFVILDTTGVVTWAGPNVETLLGRPPADFVGRHFLEVLAPSSHDVAIAAFTAFVASGEIQPWLGPPMLLDLVHADGSVVSCEVSASLGGPIGIDGAVLLVRRWRGTVLLYEVVDALVAGASLDDVLGRLVELVEHDQPGSLAVIGTGWDGTRFRHIVHRAPAGTPPELLGLEIGGSASPWCRALVSGATVGPPDLMDEPVDVAEAAGRADLRTCWAFPVWLRHDEHPSSVVVIWRRVPGGAEPHLTTAPDRVSRLVALAVESDLTRAHLEQAARTDHLTNLGNRSALMEHLERLLDDPDRTPVTLLFCDLDAFKPVNDDLGHDVGDLVLGVVADRIRAAVRPDDLVARWGGDEFAVVCADVVDRAAAGALADRLIETTNLPITVGGARIRIGLSVGIATAGGPGGADDLLRRADAGLRAAKRDGKNGWRLGPGADHAAANVD